MEREGDLRIFIGLADEWDAHPRHRAELDAQIVTAAEELLTQDEPRTWVRIQARQGMSPIAESGSLRELAVTSLPITEDLVKCIAGWTDDYEATFLPDAEGFGSEADADAFVARGRVLVGRLQAELGNSWHVEYYPEPRRPPGLRLRS